MLRRSARVALVALLAGCAAAPYTRRSQLILISPEEENKLGARAFQQVLGKSHPDGRAQVNGPVEAVGQRLARAGYDPRGALAFWQRMERAAGGNPPEFLSTHPSHGTREQQIQAWLPEAMRYYEASARADVEPLPAIAGATAR